ncbi:MAG: response regulator [Methyloprofundus sp.]|nr:response regulator [Methyloprofundus sp.]
MDIAKEILQANILIVDDEPANVKLLQKTLQRKGYQNIQATTDSREVERLCRQTEFDAILLDIRMPHIDGYGIMEMLGKLYVNDYMPVLVLTAQTDRETRLRALECGAKDFLTKPFDQLEALTRIYNLLEVRLMHKQVRNQNIILEEKVKQRTEELYETRREVINRLGLAAEYRDNETGNHIIRMSRYAQLLALEYGLAEEQAEMILNAAPMHDIGKIGIPDNILLKPGKLDPDEWAIMQTHVTIGARILSGHQSELMEVARMIALHHHEKWDGNGYPEGLKGTGISIEGRICAVVDVFDALLSERPYKKPWTIEKALNLIEEEAGKHFDPQLAPLMRKILPDILKIKEKYSDELSKNT